MKILKLFTKHPHKVGETYFRHAAEASCIAFKCQMVTCAQLIHAAFPFICPPFKTDVRSLIKYLEKKLPDNIKEDNCE